MPKELGWYDQETRKSIIWEGEGLFEIGIRADNKEVVIRADSAYFRPTEVETLLGDSSKAKEKLGWEPKISLQDMVKEMIEFDLKETKKKYITLRMDFQKIFMSVLMRCN